VVLGYDTLDGYVNDKATSVRSSAATETASPTRQFVLDGKTYTLAKNNGDNSLHGGNQISGANLPRHLLVGKMVLEEGFRREDFDGRRAGYCRRCFFRVRLAVEHELRVAMRFP